MREPAEPPRPSGLPVFSAYEPLPLTGERTTPGVPEENYWFSGARLMPSRVVSRRRLSSGFGV